MERSLFICQRLSAMALGPLVIIHLIIILYASGNGLSAEEILNRTQGNYLFGSFYMLFVLAVAIHGPIGIRNVLNEWTSLARNSINLISLLYFLGVLGLGTRAVIAVI